MTTEERYVPATIEAKWRQIWQDRGSFRTGREPNRPKKYVLEMLPYPSGFLHMGHVRNYLLGDVLARYYRMKGFDVAHPMGWDAFGLPAENAAIKDGVNPAKRTQENIAGIKAAIQALGYSYDWALEVNSSDPEYYRWNQWFFLKMREMGLVYRRFSRVNFCGISQNGSVPCFTVIANEQVREGRCERCDSQVIDKEMPEWAFRITKYSQVLLDGLDELTEWPDRITSAQRNWIGRSEGVEVDFAMPDGGPKLRVFTTRIDTVYGCTALMLAPTQRAVDLAVGPQKEAVKAFVERMSKRTKVEFESLAKEGVFTGAYAANPFSGKPVPVWAANFVLADYGTGAVMAVPGHDERDHEFANGHGLPVKLVVRPVSGEIPENGLFTGEGVLVDSGSYTGKPSADARAAMADDIERRGIGKRTISWRQKDWGFSRQRYWGTPIPIVYCDACDPKREGISVPYEDLPVRLPEIETEKVLTGKGQPPLAKVEAWVNVRCPRCGGPAKREVETMDTFVDSSWYYARYLCPHYDAAPLDREVMKRYLPVDIYIGGPEHAVMHLLYFRFWCRVMRELKLVDIDEPVKRLVTQGIVNGSDGRKMSKRWGNAVASSELVERLGADPVRVYILFAGPPERDFNWSDEQLDGASRFLKRVWALAMQHRPSGASAWQLPSATSADAAIARAAHKALARVTSSIERLSFNTAIPALMEYVNELVGAETSPTMHEAVRMLAVMLTPFAPHLANEIAGWYGSQTPLEEQHWPTPDPALIEDEVVPYAVQVMGKLRAEVLAPRAATEAEVRALVEANDKVRAALAGKTVKKFVFVPRRLVNFVVG